jgi:hypothetical protein
VRRIDPERHRPRQSPLPAGGGTLGLIFPPTWHGRVIHRSARLPDCQPLSIEATGSGAS